MQHAAIGTQQVFGPYGQHRKPGTIAVTPGSGSVDVQVFVSGETKDAKANPGAQQWATIDTLAAGTAKEVKLANRLFQIVPSGGATYTFIERILPGQ